MPDRLRRALLGLLVLLALSPAGVARAAQPIDPCSRGGRDSCRTAGYGTYGPTRYGVRWFGDFRRAVQGFRGATFGIDLRYGYPSRAYRYRQDSAADGLRTRNGRRVSMTALHRMNYALWTAGRTHSDRRQATAMLYVHHLMADAPRGAISPGAVGVRTLYKRLARDAKRRAGPYRVTASLPDGLTVGVRARLTVRVATRSGVAMPRTTVALQDGGDTDLPDEVRTGASGTVKVPFTPSAATPELRVVARAQGLAAPVPDLYLPTKGRARRTSQRLVGPDEGDYRATVEAEVASATATVTTQATPATITAGQTTQDTVTITGPPASWRAQVEVRLFGPAATAAELDCTGTPAATTAYEARTGELVTPGLVLDQPGFYAYQLVVPSSAAVVGTTTACPDPAEVVEVLG